MDDAPFPLKQRFWRRIAPGLAVLLAVTVAATVYAVTTITESIYLELARKRAEAVSRAVSHSAPEAWADFLSHGDIQVDQEKLRAAIDQEVRELRIRAMKVYDLAGRVLYSTDQADFAKRETNDALRKVVFDGRSSLVRIVENGVPLYEIYVPVRDEKGDIATVFELYEPVDYLDALLVKSGLISAAAPAVGLTLLLAGLGMLVGRGQREIDSRSQALTETRRKLESFVSLSAVDAAREGGDIPSLRVRLTLLYSDARDFTGYSENNPPERVVWFLNELMGIQVAAVQAHGGDIDKMIGDALLARFDGEGSEARALAAAQEIQAVLGRAQLPRPVGIGIYTGEVISGAIGAANRRDFTVIGDGVNVSARLCSAAAATEIVVDTETLGNAGELAESFGVVEDISVKGRREPVRIRRWRAAAA